MAEFLIKASDNTHSDPIKDARGCYKKGDIVDVRPDGFRWGREEGPPKFYIVKMPDLKVEDARKYMQPLFSQELNKEGWFDKLRRRQYQIDVTTLQANLTTAKAAELTSATGLTTDWKTIEPLTVDKATAVLGDTMK